MPLHHIRDTFFNYDTITASIFKIISGKYHCIEIRILLKKWFQCIAKNIYILGTYLSWFEMTIFNLIKTLQNWPIWPIEVNEIVPSGNTNLKIAILITFQKKIFVHFSQKSPRTTPPRKFWAHIGFHWWQPVAHPGQGR
jgi:hypothetical protein